MTRPLAALLLAASMLLGACDPAPPPASPSSSVAVASGSPSSAPSGASASASAGPSAVASPSTPASRLPATPAPASTPSPPPAPTPTPRRTPAPAISEFPQAWAGTWQDPVTGGSGSLELTLTGKGADFGGSITMDGTACLSGGILTGAYDGRAIEFTIGQRDVEIRFVGAAGSASSMSGTFTTDCDAMDGTWTVTRSSR